MWQCPSVVPAILSAADSAYLPGDGPMGERKARVTPLLLVTKAFDFAARKHVSQRRKGAAGEPYLNHLAEVADLLAHATGGGDPELVSAGILHDTLEDTDTQREELDTQFGRDIAALVAEVTDDKSLPKAERKRRQVESAPKKSHRAKMIKLADKTSNLRALRTTPPADWALERKRDYLEWARRVVDGCRGVNPELERLFDTAYDELDRELA
jgi:(p)ppGpp synthase/HD superfamily hydrolase